MSHHPKAHHQQTGADLGGRRVVLHIDRLVLRGIDPADAAAVAQALQAGLQASLALPGAANAWVARGDRAALRASNITPPPGATATELGHTAAMSIVSLPS